MDGPFSYSLGNLEFLRDVTGQAASDLELELNSFSESTDTANLSNDVIGTMLFGIYPADTSSAAIVAAALEAGNDTGQIAGGTLTTLNGSGQEVQFAPSGLETGATYTLAAVIRKADGTYTNVVTTNFVKNALYVFSPDFSSLAAGTALRTLEDWNEIVQVSDRTLEVTAGTPNFVVANGSGTNVQYNMRHTGLLTVEQFAECVVGNNPASSGATFLNICDQENDSQNQYNCRFTATSIRLIRNVNGTGTDLTTDTAVSIAAGDRIRVSRDINGLITATINGVLVPGQSVTDTTHTGPGTAGITQFHPASEASPTSFREINVGELQSWS